MNARLSSAAALGAVALLSFSPAALAKTYEPTTRSDHIPNGCSKRDCTLREAILAHNAAPGSDKIVLQAGKAYGLGIPGKAEDAAVTGDLDINGGSLTIQSSSQTKQAKINANFLDRVFDVGPVTPASVKFKLLRIVGGAAALSGTSRGGGVQVKQGSVSIVKSTVSNNTGASGAGVYSESSVSITGSTVNTNTSTSDGAGIYALQGFLNVTNSTVTENSTRFSGGGIDSSSAFASITNVTVVRNHADFDNSGGSSGGGIIRSASGGFNVRNSIIALNTVGGGSTDSDCHGFGGSSFTSLGVNLLTNPAGCTGLTLAPNLFTTNPKLGTLKNNGGPTKTIELKKGSLAINHAGSGSPKRDQRGEKRRKPDIGAFEVVKK